MCDTLGMSMAGQNIRYLLWREGVPRKDWPLRVAEWLGGDRGRAEELLGIGDRGVEILPAENEMISKALKLRAQVLREKDLLSVADLDILIENIRYLIDGLPHGSKKEFAAALEVDVTTVSRWRSGGQRPTRAKLIEIGKYFGIQQGIDLETAPIFLSLEPVSESQCREWLHEKIDQLDAQTIRNLMPAFKRLLNPLE